MQLGSCMKTADYQVLFLAVRVGVRFISLGKIPSYKAGKSINKNRQQRTNIP